VLRLLGIVTKSSSKKRGSEKKLKERRGWIMRNLRETRSEKGGTNGFSGISEGGASTAAFNWLLRERARLRVLGGSVAGALGSLRLFEEVGVICCSATGEFSSTERDLENGRGTDRGDR